MSNVTVHVPGGPKYIFGRQNTAFESKSAGTTIGSAPSIMSSSGDGNRYMKNDNRDYISDPPSYGEVLSKLYSDPASLTPAEIDMATEETQYNNHVIRQKIKSNNKKIESGRYKDSYLTRMKNENNRLEEEYENNSIIITELEDETMERPSWNKFYLVTSSPNGHLHSSMNCASTFETTEFQKAWELSGKDEKTAVNIAGERCCTNCFPTAPVEKKSNLKTREEKKTEEEKNKAKQEKTEKDQAKKEKDEQRRVNAAKPAAIKRKLKGDGICNPDGSLLYNGGLSMKTQEDAVMSMGTLMINLYRKRRNDPSAVNRPILEYQDAKKSSSIEDVLDAIQFKAEHEGNPISNDDAWNIVRKNTEERLSEVEGYYPDDKDLKEKNDKIRKLMSGNLENFLSQVEIRYAS